MVITSTPTRQKFYNNFLKYLCHVSKSPQSIALYGFDEHSNLFSSVLAEPFQIRKDKYGLYQRLHPRVK